MEKEINFLYYHPNVIIINITLYLCNLHFTDTYDTMGTFRKFLHYFAFFIRQPSSSKPVYQKSIAF